MKYIGKLCLLTAVLLSGCASVPKQSSEEEATADVLRQISDATTLAVNAQRELALTADSKVTREALRRKRMLTDVVSYDFYGDVEDILRQIAQRYDYGFEIYGSRPPERVNVNVFVTKRPVIEVLKHIGYQSNQWLDVKVTKERIELHYKAK